MGLIGSAAFSTTRSDSNAIMNSASGVAGFLLVSSSSFFSIIPCVLLIAILGTVIQKDYEYNTHPLFFTKPISKASYFLAGF